MRLDVDLVDDRADAPARRGRANSAPLSTISSIGRPMPPSLTMMTGASSIAATARVREADDRPDARVPGALDDDDVLVRRDPLVGRRDLRAEIVVDAAHDVVGGEVARQGDRRHVVERIGQAERLAHQHGVLVGARAVDDEVALPDRLQEAEPQAALADRGEQAEARGRLAAVLAGGRQEDRAWRGHAAARRLRARLRAALDEVDALAQPRHELGIDHLRLEVLAEPLEHVGRDAEQHVRIGDEELRLVVVAHQRQAALERQPGLGVRDLGAEVVALDAVGVVQEVQRVVDDEPEARAPADEPLLDLGRQPDLAELLEDPSVDGEEADQRRAGSRRRASPAANARG